MTAATCAGSVRPRPHQLEAIEAAERAYRGGASRVQWRVACGAGKSLASMWLAGRLNARTVIVFAPSVALVSQTLRVWRNGGLAVRTLAVCSDPTTAAGRAEIGVDGINPWASHEVSGVVTMRPDVVARFLDDAEAAPGMISVVVATYQSCGVIGEAFELADRVKFVDLLIADESHHLVSSPSYAPVLAEHPIRARRRLFQTATAVLDTRYVASRWDEWSGADGGRRGMDDEQMFGPVVFSLSVGQAIKANLLADYRVLVTAKAAAAGADAGETAALAALVEAARRYGVRRILSFHNRVAGAHDFARRVNDLGGVDGIAVRAAAVDGTMAAGERQRSLDLLDDGDPAVTVICSAQCLREGIDIPGVDAVLFANPRSSAVGIVQAVGRALRLHPTKTMGHIIIPVVLDEDGDDHEQLSASSYQHVWRVLRGLAAHDERVAYDLERFRGRGLRGGEELRWMDVAGDLDAMVVGRLLRQSSPVWDSRLQRLCELVDQLGSAARVTAAIDTEIASWMQLQRLLYRRGALDRDRVERLQALPGWWWDARSAADERSVAALDAVVGAKGTLRDNPSGASIYRGYKDGRGRPLGLWVGEQLCRYRSGDLPVWLHDELAARPGWTWTPLSSADEAGFEAFRSYCAWEGHAHIPADTVEGDVALGEWIDDVRRRRVLTTLSPALEAMINAATPQDKAGRRLFRWDRNGIWWQLNMEAARQYIARTGTLRGMPGGHKELVDGKPIAVWQWLSRLRHEHHTKAPLPADQVADLESLPGFVWKVEVPVAVRVDPDSPQACSEPDCDRRRSRRGLCNVHYQVAAASQKAAGVWESAYVDAEPARRHIQSLKAAGIGVRRIAELAGVDRGVILKMLRGRTDRGTGPSRKILGELAAKLLAVPQPDSAAALAAPGALIPARGTVRRLQALVADGHPRSFLAGRLGVSPGNATRLFEDTTTQVTAATARKVAALFEELKTTPGTSSRALNDGRRNTWPRPLEWDMQLIDEADVPALHR
ncbi:MAG: DEAD/DEAH box helicase family protein [Actinomycetota bacterium]|nr:DEAD/DEAH box helicase family protein [Actinomycetota bacterium]MDA2949504.1 DEAD/DEAH box helicase family protein [Actinomycetota bacterium]